MMKSLKFALPALAIAGLMGGASAYAEDKAPAMKPEAVAKYRHNQMEAIGKHTKLMYMITAGDVTYSKHAVAHAEALHGMVKTIPDMFPKGTGPDKVKSDSKAEIWTQWDNFVKLSKESEAATGKLVEASKSGEMAQIQAAFKDVRKSCGNCHDLYQEEDDH